MYGHKLFFSLLFYFAGIAGLQAQADTSLLLPTLEVSATPLRSTAAGERTEQWDSAQIATYAHSSLGELLSRETGIFIKNYGAGSLATPSVRGGSAGHTAVVWNGFALQSPMLGLLDFSLLPTHFADDIELRYGGNSAGWGSGAIGGTIALRNRPAYKQPLSLTLRSLIGSFGRRDLQFQAKYGGKQLAGSTRLFHQQADNDFPYHIRPDLPERRQSNAAFRQRGLLQEFYWKLHPGQQLGLQVWWQEGDRDIPPLTTQTRSAASQKDKVLRSALHWRRNGPRSVLQARVGFFREYIDFRDELTGLRAESRFWSLVGEVEGQWQLTRSQQIQAGINHTFTRAFADGYAEPPEQYQAALFGAFRQKLGAWQLQLNGRQGLADGALIPFVGSLGAKGRVLHWLSLRAKISRNYRLPTLNDRYWRPGGNPELKPEQGWSQEAGIQTNWTFDKHQFEYSITAFNRNIQNWILWSIAGNANYWSAQNIAEVWSRGIEQRIGWTFSSGSFQTKISGGCDFIRSTNQRAIESPRIEAGSQLIYTPEHRAFGQLQLRWKGLEAAYQHSYTSEVSSLTEPLPGYQLGHLRLSYTLEGAPLGGALFFRIENLWDASYRIVERRPMPGRHYQTGLRLQFSQVNED